MQSDDRRLIPLDTFAGVQDLEGKVDIVDGADGNPQVIATGRSTAGHKVEWMRPGAASESEQRVVQRFLDALSIEYGPRITRAIAGELGLETAGGGLDTRVVKDALRMAETQRDVFSGANFFIELTRQLRGTAGEHALPKRPEVGVVSNAVGGFAFAALLTAG